jgi:hypothetical protein
MLDCDICPEVISEKKKKEDEPIEKITYSTDIQPRAAQKKENQAVPSNEKMMDRERNQGNGVGRPP